MNLRICSALALLALVACGSPTIEAHSALTVVNVSPQDGAIDVDPGAAQSVCFSAPPASADVSADRAWVASAGGGPVGGLQVAQSTDDAHCLVFTHQPLDPGSAYVVHVEPGLRAADGSGTLPVAVDSHFQTAAVSP